MSDRKPVTAEELAEIERLDREATPGPWAYDEEDDVIETARGSSVAILTRAARPGLTHVKPDGRVIATYREAAPRLARDLTAARTEIQCIADMLDEAGIGHHEGDTVRSRLARMIADANTEARRTEQAEAERDALAAKIEKMLSEATDAADRYEQATQERIDREDARVTEIETDRDAIADRMLDLARELEALRAAVQAHREAARAAGKLHPRRDLDLWAAGKP